MVQVITLGLCGIALLLAVRGYKASLSLFVTDSHPLDRVGSALALAILLTCAWALYRVWP